MASLIEKLVIGLLAVVISFYIIGYALIPAISTGNWSDISGIDMSWVLIIVVLLVFVGFALGIFYHFFQKQTGE